MEQRGAGDSLSSRPPTLLSWLVKPSLRCPRASTAQGGGAETFPRTVRVHPHVWGWPTAGWSWLGGGCVRLQPQPRACAVMLQTGAEGPQPPTRAAQHPHTTQSATSLEGHPLWPLPVFTPDLTHSQPRPGPRRPLHRRALHPSSPFPDSVPPQTEALGGEGAQGASCSDRRSRAPHVGQGRHDQGGRSRLQRCAWLCPGLCGWLVAADVVQGWPGAAKPLPPQGAAAGQTPFFLPFSCFFFHFYLKKKFA